MPDKRPLSFLSLPKELRLMVYEWLPTVTRHHYIKALNYGKQYYFTIISKRVPGISILGTCRQIHAEATAILTKHLTNNEPLRIIANWRSVGGVAMKAVLSCASPYGCRECENLRTLLGPIKDVFRQNVLQCDFRTHAELHGMLRRSATPGSSRDVEIAVECGVDLLLGLGSIGELENYCSFFYHWMSEMSVRDLGCPEMHVTLRPMPTCEKMEAFLGRADPFSDRDFPDTYWAGRAWTCRMGDNVKLAEWKDTWEKGEKF